MFNSPKKKEIDHQTMKLLVGVIAITLASGVNAGARNAYCLDPDGVRVALFQRVPGRGHHGT